MKCYIEDCFEQWSGRNIALSFIQLDLEFFSLRLWPSYVKKELGDS